MKTSQYGSKNRFRIMTYDEMKRLCRLMNNELEICDEADVELEPLRVSLWQIIREMKSVLEEHEIKVEDVRLIGGAATFVINSSDSFSFNDIDIVFFLDSCNNLKIMDKIRISVLTAITRLLSKCPVILDRDLNPQRYIKKQVCVQNYNTKDYWSLFCLGSCVGLNRDMVELKFANSIERQYECSVDSFQIVLDPMLHFIECHGTERITKDLYPTVVAESVWGPIKDALSHLRNRYIMIEHPEQIRGGGLLKYCKLLVEGFEPHPDLDVKVIEKYMCSRFFIDFPLLSNQYDKIFSYLVNHFVPNHTIYFMFLRQLSHIVRTSSVYVGIDRLRSVFLINSIIQQVWCLFHPRISVSEFNDRTKWSVGEIMMGPSESRVGTISSSSSICTPTDLSPDLSLDIDSSHDDSSVT